jgi:hypothetical protein
MKNKTKALSLADVKRKLAGIPAASKPAIVCALVGHSRIVTQCFVYVNCARCDAQIADWLGGAGYAEAERSVVVGHNCKKCRKNYANMNWRDKFLVANPFKKAKAS